MMQKILLGFVLLMWGMFPCKVMAGSLLISDSDTGLAIKAFGGARNGTILRLVNDCSYENPDCTWVYNRGMLVSDKDPSLAITPEGGANHGVQLKLTNDCSVYKTDCTWTFKKGMLISDANPSLAINAYGGAKHGTVLRLVNNCLPNYPDCTWTYKRTMLFSGNQQGLAMNAYGGAKHLTDLKLVNNCPLNNPDCTWTYQKGMLISDRDSHLAINAYGGAKHLTDLKLVNDCSPDYTDCTWTFHRGKLISDTDSRIAINAYGGAKHGTFLKLVNDCPSDNFDFNLGSPDCVWTIGWPACPTGQSLCTKMQMLNQGMVSTVIVPGSASQIPAIVMKPWHWYFLEPSGSIRVGVLFEGDTKPEGWTTQDLAGNGYPAPKAYKYALLVKAGANGSWSSERMIENKNEELQMIFGINDQKLQDNTGAFTVKVIEIAPSYVCSKLTCPSLDNHDWVPWIMTGGASTAPPKSSSPSPSKPCEGKTSDGQMAEFLFDVFCGLMKSSSIPAQGCTRSDALNLAKHLVSYGCYINETGGRPQGSGCSDGGGEKQFKFCVTCYDNSGRPIYNALSDTACTEAQAKKRILDNLPFTFSTCSAEAWKGSCPPPKNNK